MAVLAVAVAGSGSTASATASAPDSAPATMWPTVEIPWTSGHEGSWVSVSADGSTAATHCRPEGTPPASRICVTDLETGVTEVHQPFGEPAPDEDLTNVAYDISADGSVVLILHAGVDAEGWRGELVLWDRATGELTTVFDVAAYPSIYVAELDDEGTAVALLTDEPLLAEDGPGFDDDLYRWDAGSGLRRLPITWSGNADLVDVSGDLGHLVVETRAVGVTSYHLVVGDGPSQPLDCPLRFVTDDGEGLCEERVLVEPVSDPEATREERTTLSWRSATGEMTTVAEATRWTAATEPWSWDGWWGASLQAGAVAPDGAWALWTRSAKTLAGAYTLDHHIWRPGWPTSLAERVPGGIESTSADGWRRARSQGVDGKTNAAVLTVPVPVYLDVPGLHPFARDIDWLRAAGATTGYVDGTFRPAVPVSRQALAALLWRLAGEPAPAGAAPFHDVDAQHPFADAIAWVAEQGVLVGDADGSFRPGAPLSRQALAAVLWRSAGSPPVGPSAIAFTDVPPGHPFGPAIAWLAATGIADGYADGGFHPAAPVSRQALAALLHRAHGLGVLDGEPIAG